MEPSRLEVTLSPRIFKRVQTDDCYRNELVAKIVEERGQVDNLVFIPPREDCEGTQPQASGSLSQFRNEWLEAPTKLLLSLLKELMPKVGKCMDVKSKKKMWVNISERMCAAGYMFASQQVETKFYSLERRYKNTKLHNTKTGRDKQTCPYEAELDDLLGEKRSINPVCVLDESTACSEQESFDEERQAASTSTTARNNAPEKLPKKAKKTGLHERTV